VNAPAAADDDELAGSSVFRKPPGRVWVVSFAAHAAVFAVLGVVGTFIGVKTGFIPPTIIELEAPPPRRPLPPPVAPPPRPTAPEATAPRAPRPASRPANRAPRPGRAAAPHVLAAQGQGPGNGDEMPVGDNNDFQGGVVGNGGGAVEVPRPAPEPEPEPSVHAGTGRRGPVQIPEEAVPPVAVDRPMPAYPEGARRSGVQAEVVARVVIDEDGSVSAVEILRGHPDFDTLVREVLRRWRFRPATVDGHALAVYQIVRVPFRLENL
jgi:protein TonB